MFNQRVIASTIISLTLEESICQAYNVYNVECHVIKHVIHSMPIEE